ncbi:MAG: nucleotidyltransferase substrate binding protein [Chitinispirillales bacterium]|jgi:nucleotidyltransferase substrate binding protein (TIGR01987 family)|nr:nucleotidyltransferase substrate binding protein [Chitinispirillales bacterium]
MSSDKKDIRWKQRFQNFRKAFGLLRSALEDKNIDDFSELEQEGVVQRFEYTFELGWKTFKDYLEFSGVKITEVTPLNVIKECAGMGIFDEAGIDAKVYLDMRLSRNALSHTYDFERFKKIIIKVKNEYLSQLEKEYSFFMNKDLDCNDLFGFKK